MIPPFLNYGLFDRMAGLMDVIARLPDRLSDEQTAGLIKVLPPDSANALGTFFAPHIRDVSLVFLKLLGRWMHQARRAPAEGKKVILVPFNFPPELVTAFDNAHPLTSELLTTLGVVALEGQGERYWDMAVGLGLPDHICSSNSIELGSMLGSSDFEPQAMISAGPGGCDANAKIHEFVSLYLDIPQFILEKPVDDSPEGKALYHRYYRTLITQLEDFIGEKLTEGKLRAVVERVNHCTELYWELYDLHKAKPCPVPNLFSLFVYGTRFSMWGTELAVQCMQAMVDLCKRRLVEKAYPAEREIARCLWAYTSIYYDFTNLFGWMENRGYTHMGDALDLFWPEPIDATNMETMVAGMAEAAWNMPMTRQMGGQSMSRAWVEDIVHVARDLEVDGVIYCGHHACKQTWSVVSILRSELMKRANLPLLILQGDSWNRRMTPIGVIQNEIDEFVGNVVGGRLNGKRKLRLRRRKES